MLAEAHRSPALVDVPTGVVGSLAVATAVVGQDPAGARLHRDQGGLPVGRLAPVDRVWILSGFIAKDPRFHDTGVDYVPEGRVECDRQFFQGIDVVLWARSCD